MQSGYRDEMGESGGVGLKLGVLNKNNEGAHYITGCDTQVDEEDPLRRYEIVMSQKEGLMGTSGASRGSCVFGGGWYG